MVDDVVVRALAEDLRRVLGSGSRRAQLRVMQERGGSSIGLTVDDADVLLDVPLLDALSHHLPAPASMAPAHGQRRQVVLDLDADGGYTARVVDFIGGNSFDHAARAETVILDGHFRLPGQHDPQPSPPAPSRQPTDPSTLARVAALVEEFTGRHESLTGHPLDLHPGVSESELHAAEMAIGVRLPEELRALYRVVADEQNEIGLLGRFGHLALSELVDLHHGREVTPWGVTASDPVHGYPVAEPTPPGFVTTNTSPRWRVVFADDHCGDYLAVDLAPGEFGRVGQVIRFGRSTVDVHYLADSVISMLADVVDALRSGWHPADAAVDTSDGYGPYLTDLFTEPLYQTPLRRFIDVHERTLSHALADLDTPDSAADIADGEVFVSWERLLPNDGINDENASLVRELVVRGGAQPLALRDLDQLHWLHRVTIAAATTVTADLPHRAPVQALDVEAREVDLRALAGHPTLWSVRIVGAPVRIADLAALPAVCRIDLSAAGDVDLTEITTLGNLRVLILRADQWERLRQLGVRLPRLAAA